MGRTNQWRMEDLDGYVEITPVADVKEHLAGDECWCNPVTEHVGRPLIHHNLYDDCKSYNKGYGTVPEIVLPRPDFLPKGVRENGVPVDACIADVIEHLWKNGVTTLGSCCGHGKTAPSVVLGENEREYETIETIIGEKDTRNWNIQQWQLVSVQNVDVAPTTEPSNKGETE